MIVLASILVCVASLRQWVMTEITITAIQEESARYPRRKSSMSNSFKFYEAFDRSFVRATGAATGTACF
jgi:hypothetical protein